MDPHRSPGIDEIVERITDAIMEHRLPPGLKLVEEKLAGAFNTSRTKIRQALTRLAKDGIVQLYPNRGAFVASPTIKEARDILAVRRLIEPEVARIAATSFRPAELRRLRAHLDREAHARHRNDNRSVVKLSGEFHMLLAELAGNGAISKIMNELCPVTSLVIALYDAHVPDCCPEDDHGTILEAIQSGDADRAFLAMMEHLGNIERSLDLSQQNKPEISWEQLVS